MPQIHDTNGNLINDGGRKLTYDAENRLVSVTSGDNVQFVYDPDGKRIKKTEGGQTTVYVGKHYEKNTTIGVVTKYEALGQPVATWQTGVGTTYLYATISAARLPQATAAPAATGRSARSAPAPVPPPPTAGTLASTGTAASACITTGRRPSFRRWAVQKLENVCRELLSRKQGTNVAWRISRDRLGGTVSEATWPL